MKLVPGQKQTIIILLEGLKNYVPIENLYVWLMTVK